MIRDTAKQFSEENLMPFAMEWDKNSIFPIETIKSCGELGFGGIYVGEKYGGSGLNRVDA